MKKITYEDIVNLESDLRDLKGRYVRQQGWTETCAYPDHCWRWYKSFDGIAVTENLDGAVALEAQVES